LSCFSAWQQQPRFGPQGTPALLQFLQQNSDEEKVFNYLVVNEIIASKDGTRCGAHIPGAHGNYDCAGCLKLAEHNGRMVYRCGKSGAHHNVRTWCKREISVFDGFDFVFRSKISTTVICCIVILLMEKFPVGHIKSILMVDSRTIAKVREAMLTGCAYWWHVMIDEDDRKVGGFKKKVDPITGEADLDLDEAGYAQSVIVYLDETKCGQWKYHRGMKKDGVWVAVLVDQYGNIVYVPIPDRSRPTIRKLVQEFMRPGSGVQSDSWGAYLTKKECLALGICFWEKVVHEKEFKRVDEDGHVICSNRAEGENRGFKRFLSTRGMTWDRLWRESFSWTFRRWTKLGRFGGEDGPFITILKAMFLASSIGYSFDPPAAPYVPTDDNEFDQNSKRPFPEHMPDYMKLYFNPNPNKWPLWWPWSSGGSFKLQRGERHPVSCNCRCCFAYRGQFRRGDGLPRPLSSEDFTEPLFDPNEVADLNEEFFLKWRLVPVGVAKAPGGGPFIPSFDGAEVGEAEGGEEMKEDDDEEKVEHEEEEDEDGAIDMASGGGVGGGGDAGFREHLIRSCVNKYNLDPDFDYDVDSLLRLTARIESGKGEDEEKDEENEGEGDEDYENEEEEEEDDDDD